MLSKTTWPKGPEKGTAAPGVGAQDGGWTTEAASKATSCGTVLRPHSRVKPEDRQDLVPHPTTERRARRPCISCRLRHYQPAGARPRGRRGEADRNGGHLANAFQDLSRSNYSVHGWVRNKKGAAGIDEMTVDELGAHPKEHWPEKGPISSAEPIGRSRCCASKSQCSRAQVSPRRRPLRIRAEKKLSTASIQEAEVGVKWNTQRG